MLFGINKNEIDNLPFSPGQPHLYRSTDNVAFNSAIQEGKLWLRPDYYFRELEDKEFAARGDAHEGRLLVSISGKHGSLSIIETSSESFAQVGFSLPKHYILSFHGPNADTTQIQDNFKTTHIFGVKNIHVVSEQIFSFLHSLYPDYDIELRYGQIMYFYYNRIYEVSNTKSSNEDAYTFNFKPVMPTQIQSGTDPLLVKRPYFGYQDEWRILVLFKRKEADERLYVNGDNYLEVAVDKIFFYEVNVS